MSRFQKTFFFYDAFVAFPQSVEECFNNLTTFLEENSLNKTAK